jgi:hypothetical protein
MDERQFVLGARIHTTDHAGVQIALARLLPHGSVNPTDEGFRVEAVLEGTSAEDLSRMFLSALRRIDQRVTLHAAWTAAGITEHFFDYTARGTSPAQAPEVE